MKKNDLIISIILGLTAIISRVPLLEKYHSHWDGPQYAIAIINYSLKQETPGPPGYPLYIGLGKFINLFFNDPYISILLVSVFGSAFAAIVFYIGGKIIFNRTTGIIASLIFLTGSTFYYFGLTPYAYILLPGMTMLTAAAVYKIYIKKENFGILYGLILGIYFGIRPQEIIQVGALMLLGFIFLKKIEKLKAVFVFITITLCWLIPLVYITGPKEYFIISTEFAKTAIFNNSFAHRAELILKGFLLSFGISAIFLAYYPFKFRKQSHYKKLKITKMHIFFTAWILPGLIYNLFIRTEHAGYQMTYLSGFLLLIAYAISKTLSYNKYLLYSALFAIYIFNLYWFFYDRDPKFIKPYRPTSFHYSDIRKNDLKIGSKTNYIMKHFNPENTLLVSTETMWRPYSYHLKEFRIIAINALDNTTAPYKYVVHDSQYWKMKKFENTTYKINIPTGTQNIVFMDDSAYSWLKNKNKRKAQLHENIILTVLEITNKKTIKYNYHNINVIKNEF